MAKVFSENKGKSPRPLRNGYDHSFQNLLTGNYGYIYPINVEELNPGESIKIQDTVAVRSHPVVFPVSTRIKAYVHYFAVRNRLLVKDWENFINGLDPDAKLPYLKYTESQAKRLMCNGSLFDYLGGPTTVCGNFDYSVKFSSSNSFYVGLKATSDKYNDSSIIPCFSRQGFVNTYGPAGLDYLQLTSVSPSQSVYHIGLAVRLTFKGSFDHISTNVLVGDDFGLISSPSFTTNFAMLYADNDFVDDFSVLISATSDGKPTVAFSDSDAFKEAFNSILSQGKLPEILLVWVPFGFDGSDMESASTYSSVVKYYGSPLLLERNNGYFYSLGSFFGFDRTIDATDDRVISDNRYVSHAGADPVEPLTSLYHRAYEMIYNYYYRNSQNNPYNPTGNKVEYNKFIPTDESGWDTNEYELRRRNWELDAYTSAVPSPQFGDAPLIGISYTGGDTADFVFEVTDEQQNLQKVKATLRVDPESGVLSGVQSFDESVPSGNIRNLMDLSTYGISINAIRNANAFQLFKEDTLQHPLRYRDQIYAHWGVNVDYPDVDVPEFIGGTSADLVVSQVTNMSESDNAPLGDIAGKIDAVFNFKHPVKYHAKEHTVILGVISIVPVPTYSQLCPKRFLRHSMFDFYQRRFGKIGYVPIFRSEIMPLQSQDPDEVFGYQRAWYEYMSRVNEVHGDFRTSLSDFVIMRQFKDEPQLNEDFTVVDPDSVTNIFATDKIQDKYGSSDKFMIQVYHDTSYISVIPKFGRASLE